MHRMKRTVRDYELQVQESERIKRRKKKTTRAKGSTATITQATLHTNKLRDQVRKLVVEHHFGVVNKTGVLNLKGSPGVSRVNSQVISRQSASFPDKVFFACVPVAQFALLADIVNRFMLQGLSNFCRNFDELIHGKPQSKNHAWRYKRVTYTDMIRWYGQYLLLEQTIGDSHTSFQSCFQLLQETHVLPFAKERWSCIHSACIPNSDEFDLILEFFRKSAKSVWIPGAIVCFDEQTIQHQASAAAKVCHCSILTLVGKSVLDT
jgi:hypothetical protein